MIKLLLKSKLKMKLANFTVIKYEAVSRWLSFLIPQGFMLLRSKCSISVFGVWGEGQDDYD